MDPNRQGPYELELSRLASNGRIAGNLAYAGATSTGTFIVQLFDGPTSAWPFYQQELGLSPGAFTLQGLMDRTYYLRAFRDVNGNRIRDAQEPQGTFGLSASSPTAASRALASGSEAGTTSSHIPMALMGRHLQSWPT